MPRQLRFLPGIEMGVNLQPQRVHLVLQSMQLAARLLVLARCRFQLGDLALNPLQFMLRLGGCFHDSWEKSLKTMPGLSPNQRLF